MPPALPQNLSLGLYAIITVSIPSPSPPSTMTSLSIRAPRTPPSGMSQPPIEPASARKPAKQATGPRKPRYEMTMNAASTHVAPSPGRLSQLSTPQAAGWKRTANGLLPWMVTWTACGRGQGALREHRWRILQYLGSTMHVMSAACRSKLRKQESNSGRQPNTRNPPTVSPESGLISTSAPTPARPPQGLEKRATVVSHVTRTAQ
ncbi:hypothetical protein S40288_10769 [Stachybotrys chartarum IBT 40288]|nr:hypothetical protein S40288_10769 [Stachybotrys chartarum IBT 40288]